MTVGAASARAPRHRDAEYTVVAAVLVPHSLDYRYYGADEFVMGAEQFSVTRRPARS